MLLVWGHKYDLEFRCMVETDCPECHQSPMELHLGKKKFTIYWISAGTMSEGYYLKCPRCRNEKLYQVETGLALQIIQES